MSPVKSGTKERIVEASVKLFAQQGFSATTTREIARLADVNECTVFRYFPTKHELFWTAVRSRLERLCLGKELDIALAKDEDPKKVVPRIVAFLVQTVTYHPELMRLIRFSLLEQQSTSQRLYRQDLSPIFQAILGYIERSMRHGALRSVDPSITAVGLLATVFFQQGIYDLFLGDGPLFANTDEAIAAYTNFWLRALMPEADVISAKLARSTTVGSNALSASADLNIPYLP